MSFSGKLACSRKSETLFTKYCCSLYLTTLAGKQELNVKENNTICRHNNSKPPGYQQNEMNRGSASERKLSCKVFKNILLVSAPRQIITFRFHALKRRKQKDRKVFKLGRHIMVRCISNYFSFLIVFRKLG